MEDQSTKGIALMAKAVTVTFILISRSDGYAMHLGVERPKAEPSECWCRDTYPFGILVIALLLYMPRARGRPRRGTAWYAFDSRRKRQKKFERALAMACTRRTRKPWTPPMAYVEEIVPDEPIQVPPAHLLFTVLDNWDPPTCFVDEAKPQDPGMTHSHKEGDPAWEHTTCYVEEEFSGSTEEKANSASDEFSEEAAQQDEQQGQQGGRENEETEGSGVQKPIPLSSAQGEWQDQPPLLHPEHLELIFETRSMVDDQIYRALQVSQCLDMMYAAYSNTSPSRQCPTCAQPFALPARWGKNDEVDEDTG
jgi:hypothetical protein